MKYLEVQVHSYSRKRRPGQFLPKGSTCFLEMTVVTDQ